MGGELVSDLPSNYGGEGNEPPSPFAYTNLFKKTLPQYLAMGMTPEQFYYGDCELTCAYREAYELKQSEYNYHAWMQGMYVYEAIGDNAPLFHVFSKNPRPLPYPEKPYGEEEPEEVQQVKEDNRMQNGINFMTAAMTMINNTIKGGKENG